MLAKEPKFISLKEAAQLSGYSADYVGQLIRSGKLPGKQVFSNVAWMTTEAALNEYMNKDKVSRPEKTPITISGLRDRFFSLENLSAAYRYALVAAVIVLSFVVLFLGYVLAVSIDHRIESQYLQKVEYDN